MIQLHRLQLGNKVERASVILVFCNCLHSHTCSRSFAGEYGYHSQKGIRNEEDFILCDFTVLLAFPPKMMLFCWGQRVIWTIEKHEAVIFQTKKIKK